MAINEEFLKELMVNAIKTGVDSGIKNYTELQTTGFTVFKGENVNAFAESISSLSDIIDTVFLSDNILLVYNKEKELGDDVFATVNTYKDDILTNGDQFSKLDEAKIKQITKEELQNIWNEKNLEDKRLKVIELIDSLEYKSTSLAKILEKVKTTKNPNELDKIVTNLMFVGHGEKVIKI